MSTRTGALDKALAERAKLDSLYKASKREERSGMYADPIWGEKLWDFTKSLNHFGPDGGDRMIAYVTERQRNWLRHAPYEFRCAALTACSERQQKIRVKAGMLALDDPLPGQPDDVFQKCKRIIGL